MNIIRGGVLPSDVMSIEVSYAYNVVCTVPA